MTATQVPLSSAAAVLIGLAALAVTVIDSFWLILRYGTVMAHEGAHAAASALLFRKVSRIGLNMDATGVTISQGGGCLGSIILFFIGYLGPSLFGLAAAKLIEKGHIVEVLWATLFLLALLLIAVWGSFGMITVVIVGALIFLIVRYAPAATQIVAAYAITWLLLLSGVRGTWQRGSNAADAAALRSMTLVPSVVWFLLWLAGTVIAVAIGGKWLVLGT
ncbi:MAG TPA: M50 family metallopeptidase [Streptosporangiaceae bacterium]